jgi:hypothetical protein
MNASEFKNAVRKKLKSENRFLAGMSAQQDAVYDALRKETPVWRGTLRDNWLKRPIKRVGNRYTWRIINDMIYAHPQNRGTKPPHYLGRSGIRDVQKWAQDKIGLDAKKALGFAFAYRAKLKRMGMLVRLGGNRGTRFAERAVAKSQARSFVALRRGFRRG